MFLYGRFYHEWGLNAGSLHLSSWPYQQAATPSISSDFVINAYRHVVCIYLTCLSISFFEVEGYGHYFQSGTKPKQIIKIITESS